MSQQITKMSEAMYKLYSASPVSINLLPRYSVETICCLIDIMTEEGFPMLEILARPCDDAESLIRELNNHTQRKEIVLAVGTIKRAAEARRFAELRPDVLVSPAFSQCVLDVAVEHDLPYLPGVTTLQDIQNIIDAFDVVGREVKVLKLCPVEIMSLNYVKILSAIYPEILFCPTGTVTMENLPMWKSLPCIGPAMESHFIPDSMLDTGDEKAIRDRLREIRRIVKS